MAPHILPPTHTPMTFSGHETFVLRSNWLKKAFDLLGADPGLFYSDDAFVRLGVGKNMAQSIRFWGRVCNVFDRVERDPSHHATWLGHALFDDATGWDPFLVTPTSHWLIHWQIASRPEAAFTWYYTFNLLRRGEFTVPQLAQKITDLVAERGGKPPSAATIGRDIDCMVRCYVRPDAAQLLAAAEDALYCPLYNLNLIHQIPGQSSYRLGSGPQTSLVDELIVYAALHQTRQLGRLTIAYNDLAYSVCSPGRVFRLDEDSLVSRLLRFETVTDGQAIYSDQGGIRQVSWRIVDDTTFERELLDRAFAQERRYA